MKNTNLNITAVIIARDAAATIAACVRSLAFCSRIIVGENQSTDQTRALAQSAGAEVVPVAWAGYARTKNLLLDPVREGWILSLDADEVVSPELAQSIRQAIGQDVSIQGYWLSRRNYFLGREIKHCGWSPDWQLRLFRAGTGRFTERLVHEALAVSGITGRLTGALEHYSYRTLGDYLQRMNTYTSLAAQDRARRGKKFSLWRLWLDPIWTFKKMFVLKSGWRDGFPGFMLCALSALNTLVKHAKLWEVKQSKR